MTGRSCGGWQTALSVCSQPRAEWGQDMFVEPGESVNKAHRLAPVLHRVSLPLFTRWLIESPNLGNVSHKQGGIAETVKKCNGELGIKLAAVVVAVTLVVKQWGKAHWNAGVCQYLHSHWEPIRIRNPNALCKSCWMLCIFCSSSYRGACFQFVPSVRHHSAYFDILNGIFRKCDSANAFWTRYSETAIGWRFRIVQKKRPKRVIDLWRVL